MCPAYINYLVDSANIEKSMAENGGFMGDKELKAHAIIHTCAITSAIAAGAYSAIPVVGPLGIIVGLDTAFLTPLTIGMVIYIGKLFGHSYSFSTIMAGVSQVVGMVLGLNILRGVLSIIPGAGSIANAAITFSLQETYVFS